MSPLEHPYRGPQAGRSERKREARAPSAQTSTVVPARRGPQRAWPGEPAPQRSASCKPATAWPEAGGASASLPPAAGQLGCGPGRPSSNPKAVHLAAKPTACGCQVLFCGQSKMWNGFSVPFYTKGTNCRAHPLY